MRGAGRLGRGMFWDRGYYFSELAGVQMVTSGYTGGETPRPTYGEVATGRTGHAEAVEVVFAPEKISYEDILKVLFFVSTTPRVGTARGGPRAPSTVRSFSTRVGPRRPWPWKLGI